MTTLRREIGMWRGVALNIIDMVGIGPFITIPLILSAMGGPRCMAAWLMAGLLAISDGLVTAELGAQMPHAGGAYAFLRESLGRAGKLVSFLFLFQVLITSPLSIASGCIGFAQYLSRLAPWSAAHQQITATCVALAITVLLLRKIDDIGRFSILLWLGVMLTIALVIGVGLPHLKMSAFEFWSAPRVDGKLAYAGFGTALILAVYDYLGYYNIAYLGGEVKEPEKTIPRVIVISVLVIAAVYIVMQALIVSVVPMGIAMKSKFVVADYMERLAGPTAARWITVLILWTAFASVFSVMLGYSRILFAAARDRNFFAVFGRLHPTQAYPYVSVLFLGTVAALFCWLPLPKVVAGIVTIRSVIPFMAQIVGAVLLRIREPERRRPFKMWLYPLPAIVALGLWIKAALSPEKGLQWGAAIVIAVGAIFFFSREALLRRYERV
ncbi:MAG TPA: amino acid permease [Thermoanaerobaculia bacterium]|nr:amino acid permease [Thermoanaerobaculia bacterium]